MRVAVLFHAWDCDIDPALHLVDNFARLRLEV